MYGNMVMMVVVVMTIRQRQVFWMRMGGVPDAVRYRCKGSGRRGSRPWVRGRHNPVYFLSKSRRA